MTEALSHYIDAGRVSCCPWVAEGGNVLCRDGDLTTLVAQCGNPLTARRIAAAHNATRTVIVPWLEAPAFKKVVDAATDLMVWAAEDVRKGGT